MSVWQLETSTLALSPKRQKNHLQFICMLAEFVVVTIMDPFVLLYRAFKEEGRLIYLKRRVFQYWVKCRQSDGNICRYRLQIPLNEPTEDVE